MRQGSVQYLKIMDCLKAPPQEGDQTVNNPLFSNIAHLRDCLQGSQRDPVSSPLFSNIGHFHSYISCVYFLGFLIIILVKKINAKGLFFGKNVGKKSFYIWSKSESAKSVHYWKILDTFNKRKISRA